MNNILQFRYPRYSEVYFARKREIEARMKEEMKNLSDLQPFYEEVVAIISRFPLPCPVKLRTYGTIINYEINLGDTFHIVELEPLIRALSTHFKTESCGPNYCSSYHICLQWNFYHKPITLDSPQFIIQVDLGNHPQGLTITRSTRVTHTTEYSYEFDNPFWGRNK